MVFTTIMLSVLHQFVLHGWVNTSLGESLPVLWNVYVIVLRVTWCRDDEIEHNDQNLVTYLLVCLSGGQRLMEELVHLSQVV